MSGPLPWEVDADIKKKAEEAKKRKGVISIKTVWKEQGKYLYRAVLPKLTESFSFAAVCRRGGREEKEAARSDVIQLERSAGHGHAAQHSHEERFAVTDKSRISSTSTGRFANYNCSGHCRREEGRKEGSR